MDICCLFYCSGMIVFVLLWWCVLICVFFMCCVMLKRWFGSVCVGSVIMKCVLLSGEFLSCMLLLCICVMCCMIVSLSLKLLVCWLWFEFSCWNGLNMWVCLVVGMLGLLLLMFSMRVLDWLWVVVSNILCDV